MKRVGIKAGDLTDVMWVEYCDKRGLDPATGRLAQLELRDPSEGHDPGDTNEDE